MKRRGSSDEQLKKSLPTLAEKFGTCAFSQLFLRVSLIICLISYSPFEAMKNKTEQDGYQYYLMHKNGCISAFMAFSWKRWPLFLSMKYIKKDYREEDLQGRLPLSFGTQQTAGLTRSGLQLIT
jgi:hypothetical protein